SKELLAWFSDANIGCALRRGGGVGGLDVIDFADPSPMEEQRIRVAFAAWRRQVRSLDRVGPHEGGEESMPLCIAGMHRSGTSMVTRLLNLCGLEIGRQSDLLRPRSSNPEGFWENRRFIRINDAVLREQ